MMSTVAAGLLAGFPSGLAAAEAMPEPVKESLRVSNITKESAVIQSYAIPHKPHCDVTFNGLHVTGLEILPDGLVEVSLCDHRHVVLDSIRLKSCGRMISGMITVTLEHLDFFEEAFRTQKPITVSMSKTKTMDMVVEQKLGGRPTVWTHHGKPDWLAEYCGPDLRKAGEE